MNYHSKRENPMIVKPIEQETMMTDEDHSDYFPFSIVSSMEKGTLNRYDNIWPYGKFLFYTIVSQFDTNLNI